MDGTVSAPAYCFCVSHYLLVGRKLLEIVVAGGFGGLVSAASLLFESGRNENDNKVTWVATNGVPVGKFLWGQAMIGSGGAFAAVFGMLAIGNAVRAGTTADITDLPIYLACLCVVGGFVGNKLLTGVGNKLTEQVTDALKASHEARTEAKRATATANQTKVIATDATNTANHAKTEAKEAKNASAQNRGLITQMDKVTLDVSAGKAIDQELEDTLEKGLQPTTELRSRALEMLKRLKEYSEDLPTNRALTIVLANLNFDLDCGDEAFAVLNRFIEARRNAAMVEDEDDEVAWFNIACYSSLLSEKASGEDTTRLLEKARDAIAKSLAIAQAMGAAKLSSRLAKVMRDDDLKAFRATALYQPVLDSFQPGVPSPTA